MQTLDEFLTNGRLPFVGRSTEIDRITSFAAGTLDTRGLRVALITGEAGVGKSRFIEELLPRLDERRQVVVHVKFHPESNISLTSLLAHALERADIGHRLLKVRPEETIPSVIAALRRCARLRPTLLLLEDVEQLQGESVAGFASLVTAIADETLAMLCMARPVELEVRGVLERYLVEEFALGYLDESAVETIWEMMFSSPPTDAALDAVMQATRGNALAMRAALRGAVQSGALSLDAASGHWRLTVPAQSFTTLLQRNVRVVSQGLAAHLNAEEKEAAARLAALGEVFSREAARMMLEDADAMIETLTLKGIVATAGTSVVAVNLRSSLFPPLAFTHTLTHQRLADHASIEPDRLVQLVAAAPPLYSTLPFQFLLDKAGGVGSQCPGVQRAIVESLAVARILDSTAAWQKRVVPWGAATALISRFVTEWDAATCADMQATLLRYDLFLHSRNPLDQRQLVDRIMQFTERGRSRPMAEARLVALAHRLKEQAGTADAVFRDVDEILERHPDLAGDLSYCYFLGLACEALVRQGDHARLRQLEERLEEAYTSSYLDEEGRRQLLESHLGLLLMFETGEELQRRFDLLARLESESLWLAGRMSFEKAELLLETGRIEEASVAVEQSMKYSEERDLREERWQLQTIRLGIGAALGEPAESIDAEATRFLESVAEGRLAEYSRELGERLALIALLRGEADWGRRIADNLAGGYTDFPPLLQIPLILADGRHRRFERLRFDPSNPHLTSLGLLVGIFASGDPLQPSLLLLPLRTVLATPLLRLSDILLKRDAIDLAIATAARSAPDDTANGKKNPKRRTASRQNRADDGGEAFTEAIRDAVIEMFEWLSDPSRQLDPLMKSLLRSYREYLSEEESGYWEGRIGGIATARSSATPTRIEDERTMVTMLGTIEVIPPEGEMQKVTGLRARTLLGLLTAERMLREPLEYEEFCRIAAGAREYDKAARVATNGIVWRLRDLLGHDAIDTTNGTPRFNGDRVRVDLIEAYDLLEDTLAAIRTNSLVQAIGSLTAALEIAGGKVPFPTLYDDFFEALRSDFETHLQSTITHLANALFRERDYDGAADILEEGLKILPGDGELTELLCESLTSAGKRGEAERIRGRE